MARKYSYNSRTLLYEKIEEPGFLPFARKAAFVAGVLASALLYLWLYTSVFGLDLPKTAKIRKDNSRWAAKVEIMDSNLDRIETVLSGVEQRNDDVYRTIFGLDPIPRSVKDAGFGGANRYDYLEPLGSGSLLSSSVRRLDVMTKRACIQSKTLDEITFVARKAENMVACVPSVPPIRPLSGSFRISSSFGRRSDPVFRRRAFHDGVDFATKMGNPVYATGDGVVERVRYQHMGYGNEIVINHGFGYKTRYAHLKAVYVSSGQKLHRGQKIGAVGNTGKSTGPHLHYEVIYMGKPTNPSMFYDLSMGVEEFDSIVAPKKPGNVN